MFMHTETHTAGFIVDVTDLLSQRVTASRPSKHRPTIVTLWASCRVTGTRTTSWPFWRRHAPTSWPPCSTTCEPSLSSTRSQWPALTSRSSTTESSTTGTPYSRFCNLYTLLSLLYTLLPLLYTLLSTILHCTLTDVRWHSCLVNNSDVITSSASSYMYT